MAHLSLKQRSPFRNSFIPSRRQSRQTDAVYRATGTFLQVLHYLASFLPARTCEPVYRRKAVSFQRSALNTPNKPLFPNPKSLNPAPFARAAAVVGDGRRVLDGLDVEPVGLERPDGGLPSRPGPRHPHVHGTHAVLLGAIGAVGRGQLRREGGSLAGALEPYAPGRGPGQDATLLVRDRDDRVVEGGLHGRDRVRDVLLFFLRRARTLALGPLLGLLRCRGRWCRFSHSSLHQ